MLFVPIGHDAALPSMRDFTNVFHLSVSVCICTIVSCLAAAAVIREQFRHSVLIPVIQRESHRKQHSVHVFSIHNVFVSKAIRPIGPAFFALTALLMLESVPGQILIIGFLPVFPRLF